MPPKAKPKAKAKAKAKARPWRGRVLPVLPAPLVPEQWYVLPGGQGILEQLRSGQLLQVEVEGGTALLEILGLHPRDPQGIFIETGFRGGSTETIQRWGDTARAQHRDLLLHLCCGARGCQSDVAGRLVLHTRRLRVREERNITEAWFERGPQALPGVERAVEPRESPEEAVMSKVKALRDRVLTLRGGSLGGQVETQTPGEADAILAEAERALHQEERAARARKGDVRGELAARASSSVKRKHSRGRSRHRRRRGSSSSSRSSSSGHGHAFRDSNKVARLAE
eukprot:6457503-Amphidinium_carterae.1